MNPSDQKYLEAIARGDENTLQEIYRLYFPRIDRFIQSKGGSADDAKDVFQDAILVIYEKAKRGNLQLTSQFYTLLNGVCRNIWGNHLQKKARSGVIKTDLSKYKDEFDVQQLIEQEEENKVFWDSFKKLGADCQKLLQLFFAKKKMVEIQKQMGFGSLSYTKKRKFYCKEKLIEWVKTDIRYTELGNSN